MNSPALLCGTERLFLGERIGRGGEGEVYAIADGSGRAVKIYLESDAAREAKIDAIVAARLGDTCRNVAFPLDIVRTSGGRFAGFTMRRVTGHQPIHELTAPVSRRQYFPDVDWRFLVRVAANVARIVATVHARNVVIGDINSSGFLVSQHALVRFTDADSFQLASHRCPVGMGEYTPPELQRVQFADVDRTADHDAFGLAVLIFQILALGRHPHVGVPHGRPVPIETAIMQGQFAYSQIREVGTSPPPGTLLLGDLPKAIALLFERAFAPRASHRPFATDWVRELAILESGLVRCAAQSLSFRRDGCGTLPLVPDRSQNPSASISSQQQALNSGDTSGNRPPPRCGPRHSGHQKYANETIEPVWPRPDPAPSRSARKLMDTMGSGLIRRHALNHGVGDVARFIECDRDAKAAATRALDAWRTNLGIWDGYKLSDWLRTAIAEIDRIQLDRSGLLARARERLVAEQVATVMRKSVLSAADIPGIGNGLCANLAKHGLDNAADITRLTLSSIAGLGEARIVALLLWREAVVVEAERAVMQSDVLVRHMGVVAEARLDQHAGQLESAIRAGIDNLESRVAEIRQRAARIDTGVLDALHWRDQAAIDLEYLGIDRAAAANFLPANAIVTRRTRRKGKAKSGKLSINACPVCAAPMVRRWANNGHAGPAMLLGCSRYPQCNGRRPIRK